MVGVVNFEQIGVVADALDMNLSQRSPKRYVEVFHRSFVIDTVHNALETRTVLQCLLTHFVWVIIGIVSRLRAAVSQNCTHRNLRRCFA